MKKVLSVILAIMMVAAFTPMAFAEGECKHAYDVHAIMREGYTNCENCGVRSADFTECFKSYVKFIGTAYSLAYSKINNERILWRVQSDFADTDVFNVHRATYEDQSYVDSVTKTVDEYVEALKEEFTVYFDATDLMTAVFTIEAYEADENQILMFSDDILAAAEQAFKFYTFGVEESHEAPEAMKDCIEYGKKATYYYTSIISCLEGNHQCTAYTDNGDGTHSTDCTFCNTKNIISDHEWGEYVKSEDGLKIAECKYCDATDTDSFERDIRDFFKMLINLIKSFIEAVF